MDEITMYAVLRPQAPGNAGELTGQSASGWPGSSALRPGGPAACLAGGGPDRGYAVTIQPSAIPRGIPS
jgi:hypothetical protein